MDGGESKGDIRWDLGLANNAETSQSLLGTANECMPPLL